MGTSYQYSYADCRERAKRARWELDDFDEVTLDFTKPFLPEPLARTSELAMLDTSEQLRLNQIRGHSYAHIFRFMEEYIVDLFERLGQAHTDIEARTACEEFAEEERKHQQLFSLFQAQFTSDFGSPCETIEGAEESAAAVLSHSTLSVLLLTAMLEWLTQVHYLAYFNERSTAAPIDEAFCDLLRLHWVEEAQHARLDNVEALAIAATITEAERLAAIDEFLELCDVVRALVERQAELDVQGLVDSGSQRLTAEELESLVGQQRDAMANSFVLMGLGGRHFRQLVSDLHPGGLDRIDNYLVGDR